MVSSSEISLVKQYSKLKKYHAMICKNNASMRRAILAMKCLNMRIKHDDILAIRYFRLRFSDEFMNDE